MWGLNSDGQLGIDSKSGAINFEDPTLIGTGFSQVAVADYHTVAIKSDGSLWSWGNSVAGELGNGRDRGASAVASKIGEGFTQVATGFVFSAAIKNDGTLWLWGGKGIYGDCSDRIHNTPTRVGDGFIQVAVGRDFVLAAKDDGTVWTWGWPVDEAQRDVAENCRKPSQVLLAE